MNFAPSDRVLTADSDDNVTVSCRLSYFATSHWIPRVQCLPSVEDQTEVVVDVTPGRVSYSKSFAATPEINGVVLDCIAKFNATGYTPAPDLPLWKSQPLRVQCTQLLRALLPRDAICIRDSAVLSMGQSVSVSVRLSQVGVLSKRMNESSWFLACKLLSTSPPLC